MDGSMSNTCGLLQRLMRVFLVLEILSFAHVLRADEEASIIQFPDPVPDFIDDAMRYLSFDDSHKNNLLEGKVLFSGMPDMEVLDEQLTVVGVMLVINRPMHEIVELILAGEMFRGNNRLIGSDLISDELSVDGVTLSTFRNVHYTKDEQKEINRLLRAGPGTEYNFNKEELARFGALDAGSFDIIEQVSALYRDILLQIGRASCRERV